MRIGTTGAALVYDSERFDSKYFLDEGRVVFERVRAGKWTLTTPAAEFGREFIWMPNRFVRVPACSEEFGRPLLVPYDCFRYLPHSNEILSNSQVGAYESALLKRGWVLIVRWGPNLGPATLVDSFLERFAVSDDMIRISCPLSNE